MRFRYFLYLTIISGLSLSLFWLQRFEPVVRPTLDPAQFLGVAVESANDMRRIAALQPLETSFKLQKSIQDFVEARGQITAMDLHRVFSHVEASLPQVHELAANLVYAGNEERLLVELRNWNDLDYSRHTHYAAWVFEDSDQKRLGCLAVLARQLPELNLPLRADTPGAFFATCKRCQKGHGISLAEQAQNTLVVTCPNCDQPYDLIATDSTGQWRRANQFFTGFQSSEVADLEAPQDRLMAIWRDVAEKCRYQLDADRISGGDSWETPADTYRRGSGDCEDTSLLLADMLLAHGIEARVALGHHDGQGHAWCVAKIDDQQYILESTWEDVKNLDSPPSMDEVALDYHPEYLFDRDAIFFTKRGGWTCNYWSDQNWLRVEYPGESHRNLATLTD